MHTATVSTYPLAVSKRELAVLRPTARAELRAGKVAVYLVYRLALLVRNVLQNLHERVVPEVTDLASPEPLHSVEVEILDGNEVVLGKQPASQLEMPVPALVLYTPVAPGKTTLGFLAMVRALATAGGGLLARKLFVQALHFAQARFEVLRCLDLVSIGRCQEAFESEIQPDSITCSWQVRGWRFLNDREADPEVTTAITLYRDGLDFALNGVRLDKFVVAFPAAHAVPAKKLPPCLCERERGVARAFLEAGSPGTSYREEALVGLIQAVYHILPGLRVEPIPSTLVSLLELRKMALHLVVARILAVQVVVAPCQGDEVIPYLRGKSYLTNQMFVSLGTVQAVFKRLSQGLRLFVNVLLNDLLADLTRRGTEVGARPQGRQPEQVFVLLSQYAAAAPLKCVHDLVRGVASIGLQKQMNVIRLNSKCEYAPVVFLSYLFDDLPKPTGYSALQYPLASLRTPDEVILHRMNGVGTSAIFFVDSHVVSTNNTACGSRLFGGFLVCELENHQ